jgi:4-hydroxy-2-oxoglutarate aldolase
MKLWKHCNNPSPTKEEVKEAAKLQHVLSNADVAAMPAGIRGMSMLFFSNLPCI